MISSRTAEDTRERERCPNLREDERVTLLADSALTAVEFLLVQTGVSEAFGLLCIGLELLRMTGDSASPLDGEARLIRVILLQF